MQLLFGAGASTTTGLAMAVVWGFGGGGIALRSSALGLAAHANEMHRFFSTARTTGPLDASVLPTGDATVEELVVAGAWWALENSGTKPILGSWGLGELVRAGVVMPVPQVRSAVDAKLMLLVMERLLLAREYADVSELSSSE